MDAAVYMQEYTLRGQHTPDRAMTRYKNDLSKMVEDQEISTGPGRWTMGVPNVFANAAFIPTPTMINQRWGASHNMESTKTDMESDLRNLGRPTVRSTCGQYTPGTGLAANAMLTPMPEEHSLRWPVIYATLRPLYEAPVLTGGNGWIPIHNSRCLSRLNIR